MRIRAAVLEEFGAPLAVQEVELEEPRRGEALVRLVACGVCHTDLYTASGADPSGYAPTVLGHEGAGVVERVGEDVHDVAPGDHVVTLFSPQCRECIHCRDERTNLCLAIRDMQNQGYLPDGTARMGWGLATVCGVAGKGETLDIVPRFLITGRRVAGSSFGGVKGRDQVPQLVDRWLVGDIDVDPFVSHKLTLDEVNRGFELMEAQDGIRSVIDFET